MLAWPRFSHQVVAAQLVNTVYLELVSNGDANKREVRVTTSHSTGIRLPRTRAVQFAFDYKALHMAAHRPVGSSCRLPSRLMD